MLNRLRHTAQTFASAFRRKALACWKTHQSARTNYITPITSHQSKGWQRFPSFLTKISQSTPYPLAPNAIAMCRFPPTLYSCVTGTAPSFSCHSSRASEPNRQPIFEYVFILPMCAPYLQELHWLDQSRRGDMEQRLRRHWRKRCFLENESAAMCAYCRAPRIILRQGAARGGPPPWLLSPYCTVAASSYLRRSGAPALASRCFSPSKSYRSSIRMRTITSTPRTLEPLTAFAFIVDHATQRAAVHHLRIPVFHELVELDHHNPTIARAPQKIDAVPFLPVCGSVNSTCWAGARTRTGSSRRAPSPHRRFPRMAWRSGTRSGRWRSSVLRAWRMR